jgi:hypothetical protein
LKWRILACVNQASCVVGDGGWIYFGRDFRSAGSLATIVGDPSKNINGVACDPDAGTCIAYDGSGYIIPFTQNVTGITALGGSWTPLNSFGIVSASCASDQLCVAVDTHGNALVHKI